MRFSNANHSRGRDSQAVLFSKVPLLTCASKPVLPCVASKVPSSARARCETELTYGKTWSYSELPS